MSIDYDFVPVCYVILVQSDPCLVERPAPQYPLAIRGVWSKPKDARQAVNDRENTTNTLQIRFTNSNPIIPRHVS